MISTPDSQIVSFTEPAIPVTVAAAPGNTYVKWFGFTAGGAWIQNGAAGTLTANDWTSDYFYNVVEKVAAYYHLVEILKIHVRWEPPSFHTGSNQTSYSRVTFCYTNNRDEAFGQTLENYPGAKVLSATQPFDHVSYPS